jgi:hypothetical protein
MEQTFQNLDRCLKAAGATWADVVKTKRQRQDCLHRRQTDPRRRRQLRRQRRHAGRYLVAVTA